MMAKEDLVVQTKGYLEELNTTTQAELNELQESVKQLLQDNENKKKAQEVQRKLLKIIMKVKKGIHQIIKDCQKAVGKKFDEIQMRRIVSETLMTMFVKTGELLAKEKAEINKVIDSIERDDNILALVEKIDKTFAHIQDTTSHSMESTMEKLNMHLNNLQIMRKGM